MPAPLNKPKGLQQRGKQHEETAQTGHGERSGVDRSSTTAGCRTGRRRRRRGTSGTGGIDLIVADDLELDTGDLLSSVVKNLLLDGLAGDLDGGAGGSVGQTILDVVGDLGGSFGQVPGVVELAGGNQGGGTGWGLDAGLGLVVGGDTVHVDLVELLLEVVVVDQGLDGVAVLGIDETVVVVLLGPDVHKTTRESLGHLLAVQSLDLGESTRSDIVAAILGEEDREGSVGEVLSQDIVATGFVSGITAPRVGVQTEEVKSRVGGVLQLTLEVSRGIHQDGADIGGGVTNGDGTLGVLGNVLLHITDNGTNILRHGVTGILVDNLVSGEETQDIVEVLEGLDDTENLLEVCGAVGLPGRNTVQSSFGGVDIEDHVDTGRIENGSTFVVVKSGGQVVNTNSVDLL